MISDEQVQAKRRVVYSALIGSYESPTTRELFDGEDVDFILFTDTTPDSPPEGWEVVLVEPRYATDPVRSARYLKIIGHPVLDGYDETLWIDNRVVLSVPPSEMFSLLGDNDMVIPLHSGRGDLSEEFGEVIASGYDDPARVRQMYEISVAEGVTHQRPLWTGILLRKRNEAVAYCMQNWMELLLLTSRRDQLSINVAIEISNARLSYLAIDNRGSQYHEWLSHRSISRKKSVQMWRPLRRSPALKLSDLVRSVPIGRKAARALSKIGINLPTLPTRSRRTIRTKVNNATDRSSASRGSATTH